MLFLLSLILLLDNGVNAALSKTQSVPVRLADGTSACSGRVEIYTDDWGTICDEGLDEIEGNMICIEAGCGPLSVIKTGAFYGEGSGLLLTDDMNCFGNESSVLDCYWGNHSDICDHSKDAGVICDPIVRLREGSGLCSGRVEVFHNREWGTVCDNSWDITDAEVLCQERGCGKPIASYVNAYFGQGTGQIWMEGVGCTGRETSLAECLFNGWGVSTCTHADDAGVTCSEVRLSDGENSCSGRVEVLYDGWGWGTVCDDGWNLLGGDVICREVSCGTALSVTRGSSFKKGSGEVWTFDTTCSGRENHLKRCTLQKTEKTCTHNREAGVVCRQIKLVSGPNICSGTVQVRYNGDWGAVCHNNWDFLEGIVSCRELGCGPLKQTYTGAFYGGGSGEIWLDGLLCTGSESSLQECSFPGVDSLCTHTQDAGVSCGGFSNACLSVQYEMRYHLLCLSEVRLVDGDSTCSGRVEILYNNQWGTVCDDSWDMSDGEVICRELGCGDPVEVKIGAFFGSGVGPIWKDDVKCTGSEASVLNCASNAWGVHDCGHYKDAGVVCREVRLVNQNNSCQGTLQVLHDGQWGAVCHNSWDLADGVVLCRELGCGGNVQPLANAYFGPVEGPIWMDSLRCTSEESNLRDCNFAGWGNQRCIHAYDSGIICKHIKTVLRIEVQSDSGEDPNDPSIMAKILDKLKKEIQKVGNLSVRWRTRPGGPVFKEKTIFDP